MTEGLSQASNPDNLAKFEQLLNTPPAGGEQTVEGQELLPSPRSLSQPPPVKNDGGPKAGSLLKRRATVGEDPSRPETKLTRMQKRQAVRLEKAQGRAERAEKALKAGNTYLAQLELRLEPELKEAYTAAGNARKELKAARESGGDTKPLESKLKRAETALKEKLGEAGDLQKMRSDIAKAAEVAKSPGAERKNRAKRAAKQLFRDVALLAPRAIGGVLGLIASPFILLGGAVTKAVGKIAEKAGRSWANDVQENGQRLMNASGRLAIQSATHLVTAAPRLVASTIQLAVDPAVNKDVVANVTSQAFARVLVPAALVAVRTPDPKQKAEVVLNDAFSFMMSGVTKNQRAKLESNYGDQSKLGLAEIDSDDEDLQAVTKPWRDRRISDETGVTGSTATILRQIMVKNFNIK